MPPWGLPPPCGAPLPPATGAGGDANAKAAGGAEEGVGAGGATGARGADDTGGGAATDGAAEEDSVLELALEAAVASGLTARGLRTRFSAMSPASGVLSDKRVFLAKRRALASGERDVRDVVI